MCFDQRGHREHLRSASQERVATRRYGAERHAGERGLHRVANRGHRPERISPAIATRQARGVQRCRDNLTLEHVGVARHAATDATLRSEAQRQQDRERRGCTAGNALAEHHVRRLLRQLFADFETQFEEVMCARHGSAEANVAAGIVGESDARGRRPHPETRAKEARLDVGEPQRCPRDACWSRRAERVTRQDGQAQRLSKVDDFGVGGWRKWP